MGLLKQEDFDRQNNYARIISKHRDGGDLDGALSVCKEAIAVFPDDNFFYKVQGDLYFQKKDYSSAADSYLLDLERLGDKKYLFRTFIRFYRHLQSVVSEEFLLEYKKRIQTSIRTNSISSAIVESLVAFLGEDLLLTDEEFEKVQLSEDDRNYKVVVGTVETQRRNGQATILNSIAQFKLYQCQSFTKSKKIDHYIIQTLVANGQLETALQLIKKTQKPLTNKHMIALVLRSCRLSQDYSIAEELLVINHSFLESSDFNIQYELVYYYDYLHDEDNLVKTLKKMQTSATRSLSIARTLYNFCLSYGQLDFAKEVYEHIQKLQSSGKREREFDPSRKESEIESGRVVWQRLKDLGDEQEHSRQMIALKDLLKGFSHELGQPITNIRYDVQLQQMKLNRVKISTADWSALLDRILSQTERIGRLLQRFRPMVSTKGENTTFSIYECISSVFSDLDSRMKSHMITYNVHGEKTITLFGDELQFSQVFYNLILNSIQALASQPESQNRFISVKIKQKKETIYIDFKDSGPGIPKENHRKVFDPFFSTKDPTSGNGGEGLGLFIVWNVLKMFNGSIRIDPKYTTGALFTMQIKLPKEAKQ